MRRKQNVDSRRRRQRLVRLSANAISPENESHPQRIPERKHKQVQIGLTIQNNLFSRKHNQVQNVLRIFSS